MADQGRQPSERWSPPCLLPLLVPLLAEVDQGEAVLRPQGNLQGQPGGVRGEPPCLDGLLVLLSWGFQAATSDAT